MSHSPIRSTIAGLLAIGLGTGLTACVNTEGAANREPYPGSTTAAVSGGVQQVTLAVDASFRFSPSTVTVHPGQVRITLQHGDMGAPHNFQLDGFPAAYVSTVGPGQSGSVTFAAPPVGRYTFTCTIHERQGMTGTLIVSAG